MYHNCASQYSLCEGKEKAKGIYISIFSCITGIGANMLLIIFLGLIINSALLSGACDFGSPNLNDFDWAKVGIRVLK
jgi:hypothetical protein